MKKVIITGGTGMIGKTILNKCLNANKIKEVISFVRKSSDKKHPKLKEIVISNFLDYTGKEDHFKNIDAAYFCIGVYTGAVSDQKFKETTVDVTQVFANKLKEQSPNATFCFLSGSGADPTEKSKVAFAKYKGIAENILINLKFPQLYIFRPAYIYPVEKRKEPNLMYSVSRTLYPLIKLFGKNASIKSTELAMAMYKAGISGTKKMILENKDILQV